MFYKYILLFASLNFSVLLFSIYQIANPTIVHSKSDFYISNSPSEFSPYKGFDKPVAISIPSIGIKVGLQKSEEVNESWKVYRHFLAYVENSELEFENGGNLIVYGHAIPELLGNMNQLNKGETIKIYTPSGVVTYEIVSKEVVLPDEIDKISSIGDTHLSLFTCDGPNDEFRILVKAKILKLINYNNKEVI